MNNPAEMCPTQTVTRSRILLSALTSSWEFGCGSPGPYPLLVCPFEKGDREGHSLKASSRIHEVYNFTTVYSLQHFLRCPLPLNSYSVGEKERQHICWVLGLLFCRA